MLWIEDGRGSRVIEWHTGEPLPVLKSRVVRFDASDDELMMILRAMGGGVHPRPADEATDG